MDYDNILVHYYYYYITTVLLFIIKVLDKGELVEYDEPHVLLCQSSSYLSLLVDQTGPDNATRLRKTAADTHNKRKAQ